MCSVMGEVLGDAMEPGVDSMEESESSGVSSEGPQHESKVTT